MPKLAPKATAVLMVCGPLRHTSPPTPQPKRSRSSAAPTAAALAVSAITHYLADRQGGHWRDEKPRGVVRLAHATGSRAWLQRDPQAGYLLDQSWHKGWIAIAALIAAR
ncbi:hypothetical protein [Kitasatospora sp. NPDC127116]|uniref:hypothetical protein n=1 Tax=Kitasatospora sp. NPDC127116 TaxID=3345367 RepID=UPI00362EA3CB